MAIKMAEVFNTSVDWLLQGTGTGVRDVSAEYTTDSPKQSLKDLAAFAETLSETQLKEALEVLKKHFTE